MVSYSDWVATPDGQRAKAKLVCSSTTSSSSSAGSRTLSGLEPVPLIRQSAYAETLSPAKVYRPDDDVVYEIKYPLKQFVVSRSRPPGARGERGLENVVGHAAGSLPPPIQLSIPTSHTYRFRSSAAVSQLAVGLGGLLGAMGTLGKVANTSVANIHSTCRIKSITVWAPAVSAALDGCSIDWLGAAGYLPDEAWDVAVPDGITVTRAMTVTPPRKSLAEDWLNSGTIALGTTIFTVTGPEGMIIDVKLGGRICNVTGTATINVAAAAVGTMYYLALDGPASNKLQPVGVPTTS